MPQHAPESRTALEVAFSAESTPGRPLHGQHLSRVEIAEVAPFAPRAKENIISLLCGHGVSDAEAVHELIEAPMFVEAAEKMFAAEMCGLRHENGVELLRVGGQCSLPSCVHSRVCNVVDVLQRLDIYQPELIDVEFDVNAVSSTCTFGTCAKSWLVERVSAF